MKDWESLRIRIIKLGPTDAHKWVTSVTHTQKKSRTEKSFLRRRLDGYEISSHIFIVLIQSQQAITIGIKIVKLLFRWTFKVYQTAILLLCIWIKVLKNNGSNKSFGFNIYKPHNLQLLSKSRQSLCSCHKS